MAVVQRCGAAPGMLLVMAEQQLQQWTNKTDMGAVISDTLGDNTPFTPTTGRLLIRVARCCTLTHRYTWAYTTPYNYLPSTGTHGRYSKIYSR